MKHLVQRQPREKVLHGVQRVGKVDHRQDREGQGGDEQRDPYHDRLVLDGLQEVAELLRDAEVGGDLQIVDDREDVVAKLIARIGRRRARVAQKVLVLSEVVESGLRGRVRR